MFASFYPVAQKFWRVAADPPSEMWVVWGKSFGIPVLEDVRLDIGRETPQDPLGTLCNKTIMHRIDVLLFSLDTAVRKQYNAQVCMFACTVADKGLVTFV